MFTTVRRVGQLVNNMGWRYIFFRIVFGLKKKSGFLKKAFPVNPPFKAHYTLGQWREEKNFFFFKSKEELSFKWPLSQQLVADYEKISGNKFIFFSSLEYNLPVNFDWLTNLDTGYSYDRHSHWANINDYSKNAGDIKYVWEPSRFSHLFTLIRYDKHSGFDCSKQVFDEIEKWISGNDINQGPNFKCSQEISLRVLNWIFALHYYRNSKNLTDELFGKIQHYIYWQIKHVYDNINFSRIAVRNNHAITETLTLYIVGTFFPEFSNAYKWKTEGKRWFEEEIEYQIYDDGTFLQFSMNYHRVVIQLLTWGLRISELNHDCFKPVVYERAKKSLLFLLNAMDIDSGWLPNYGANDGALFFKLNDNHYRDYRPQLEALSNALGLTWQYGHYEDTKWFGVDRNPVKGEVRIQNGYAEFNKGGYYIYRLPDSLSFIRCGNHKDRPSQADNLHLDIWYKGLNILHDAGSYKYNAAPDEIKYFMGTQSHNTVMLDDLDQMEKGARFIWYNWTQCESVKTTDTTDYFYFEGTIKAYQHQNSDIRHVRKIKVYKTIPVWEIEDSISGKPAGVNLKQIWHTQYLEKLSFESQSGGEPIEPLYSEGFYSSFYGRKEKCTEITFVTNQDLIKTIINIH